MFRAVLRSTPHRGNSGRVSSTYGVLAFEHKKAVELRHYDVFHVHSRGEDDNTAKPDALRHVRWYDNYERQLAPGSYRRIRHDYTARKTRLGLQLLPVRAVTVEL